jgi:hypothetical protein
VPAADAPDAPAVPERPVVLFSVHPTHVEYFFDGESTPSGRLNFGPEGSDAFAQVAEFVTTLSLTHSVCFVGLGQQLAALLNQKAG